MSTSATRIRAGAAALAVAGVLFLAYPALRPWHDESTVAGATASMSSTAWVTAHFFAMLGFILVPLGLLALRAAIATTRAEPLALTAAVLAWIGSGLTLPYYGAEDFGLHAIAGPDGPQDRAAQPRPRGALPAARYNDLRRRAIAHRRRSHHGGHRGMALTRPAPNQRHLVRRRICPIPSAVLQPSRSPDRARRTSCRRLDHPRRSTVDISRPVSRSHHRAPRTPAATGRTGPPRVFRTAKLSLFHAASCRFRYSSRASCGVRYPSPE